jgi:hypothetical protein
METAVTNRTLALAMLVVLALSALCPGLAGLCVHGHCVRTTTMREGKRRRIMRRAATILRISIPDGGLPTTRLRPRSFLSHDPSPPILTALLRI